MVQINYYSDSECYNYLGQVDVTWASYGSGSNCYNYNYGNSVSIANFYENSYQCVFYSHANCNGEQSIAVGGSEANCITDASFFYSFQCWYD